MRRPGRPRKPRPPRFQTGPTRRSTRAGGAAGRAWTAAGRAVAAQRTSGRTSGARCPASSWRARPLPLEGSRSPPTALRACHRGTACRSARRRTGSASISSSSMNGLWGRGTPWRAEHVGRAACAAPGRAQQRACAGRATPPPRGALRPPPAAAHGRSRGPWPPVHPPRPASARRTPPVPGRCPSTRLPRARAPVSAPAPRRARAAAATSGSHHAAPRCGDL